MKLQQRIDLLVQLGDHMRSGEPAWMEAKELASYRNGWFLPEFVDRAASAVADNLLDRSELERAALDLNIPDERALPLTVGIVMAGNIPMVGFHDLLCAWLSGHRQIIKTSTRDNVLIPHLVDMMKAWEPEVGDWIESREQLKGCDAYIATGSNNTARYFEKYFARFPHIIRRNRTSIAILDGTETGEELAALADDIQTYFGLGCRNVTQVFVPENYDFIPLVDALKRYGHLMDSHKYKNNVDYNLALHILNNKFYMSSGEIILVEDASPFSPIGQLNYQFYKTRQEALDGIDPEILQCLVGKGALPFGQAQRPGLRDYADGVDTLAFLQGL